MAFLEIRGLSRRFGGLVALNKLDLDVNEHEILGIIGPNGAGKSTLFNVITGFLAPNGGKIVFEGRDITRLPPHRIAGIGIGRTFQTSSLYPKTTVFDCIYTACKPCYEQPVWKAFLNTPAVQSEEADTRQRVREIIEFLELTPHKDKLAEELSSGFRRVLAVGIAMAARPRLLLLDEPVTTLSPDRVEMVMTLVKKLRDNGTTVAIIEHNMKAIMEHCDRIAVIAFGQLLASGPACDIRDNKEVVDCYLGEML